jgi:hypothetical protein
MPSRLHSVTIDCADPVALANFWAAATGYEQHPENGVDPEDDETLLFAPGDGPRILFIRVPEGSCYRPVADASPSAPAAAR